MFQSQSVYNRLEIQSLFSTRIRQYEIQNVHPQTKSRRAKQKKLNLHVRPLLYTFTSLTLFAVPFVGANVSSFGGAALSKAAAYPPAGGTGGVAVEDVALLAVVAVDAPSAVVLIIPATLSTLSLSAILSTATDGVAKAGK